MEWNIGNAIRELRENLNLKQKELGEEIGVSAKSISNYETGLREPSIDVLNKLSKFFGVPVNFLISGNKEYTTPSGSIKLKFKSGKASMIKSKDVPTLIKLLENSKIDIEAFIRELNEQK